MSLPTVAEEYAKMMEHLRLAQECATMIAHLRRDDSRALAKQWLMVSELFKEIQHKITQLATRGLN